MCGNGCFCCHHVFSLSLFNDLSPKICYILAYPEARRIPRADTVILSGAVLLSFAENLNVNTEALIVLNNVSDVGSWQVPF